jgi:hypothetical protein
LPFAFCLLPFAFCLLPFVFCLLSFVVDERASGGGLNPAATMLSPPMAPSETLAVHPTSDPLADLPQ